MARLQILELPVEHHGDDMVTPFVLVIDQYEPPPFPADVDAPGPFDHLAEKIGARAVLAFEETIDIPANGTPAASNSPNAEPHCGEHDGPCFPEPGAKCVAHGDEQCLYCHRNPSDCANGGNCGTWARVGMHWDSCRNRVRGPLASGAPDDHHTTQIVYAHERTRLDLCNALLVSGDTTWRKLIETVSERQRVVAQSNRALDELARLLGLAVWQGWDDIKVAVEDHHTLRKVAERDAKRCEELREESRRRGKVKLEYPEKVRLLESQLEDARTWARHGYEIGQKHCGWTDHGTAPDWLTEGWPTHFDSCKHLKQATEYDTALSRVLQVADDLENEEAHGGVWDANQQAARLIRAAVGRARDEKAAGS